MGGGGGGSQAFRKLGFFPLFVGFNRVSMSPRINISPCYDLPVLRPSASLHSVCCTCSSVGVSWAHGDPWRRP